MDESRDGIRLTDAEKQLLATWRELRAGRDRSPRRDPIEKQLLDQWRSWHSHPTDRPLWMASLRHRLLGATGEPVPDTGLADGDQVLPQAPTRLLGMVLGGAVGEAVAHGRAGGERTSATLFVLEGLIRAHTGLRTDGHADPVRFAVDGLRRWLHTRGVSSPDQQRGWLVHQRALHATSTDEPTMLAALTRIAAGAPHGTRQQPINDSDAASAVPLGAIATIWSRDARTVSVLARDLAAITHGHAHGHDPAGALATTVFALLRGHSLDDSVERGLTGWGKSPPEPLTRARALGLRSPAGFLPARRQLDALGTGRTGIDALGLALRVATAAPDDFEGAVRAAADHGGDTATTAMLCGQLLGALHGPTAIPRRWLDELPATPIVERLVEDAATEFGPYPDESGEWLAHYADEAREQLDASPRSALTAVPRLTASRDRFHGAVLGCAIGEALGSPIAAERWDEIRDRHGDQGVRYYIPAGHPAGRLGSDTQLLLFSLEGMIRANASRRLHGTSDPMRHVQHAYQRWLHTQHLSWARAAGEFLDSAPEPDGWLIGQRALFQTRNPGRTMMRTLIAFAKGHQRMGTPDHPVSDSQGSTAVMRAVPAALWSSDPDEAFRVGSHTAALTHGSPVAHLSAGTLAYLVARLVDGDELRTAVDDAAELLTRHPGHEEVHQRLAAAVRLAENGPTTPPDLEIRIGTGWTAADALGIGVYAALSSGGDFDAALPLAVNHSGNSATTTAVCASLVAAAIGAERIPERWLVELELREVIERLANDAALEFGPHPPDWSDRYPPT